MTMQSIMQKRFGLMLAAPAKLYNERMGSEDGTPTPYDDLKIVSIKNGIGRVAVFAQSTLNNTLVLIVYDLANDIYQVTFYEEMDYGSVLGDSVKA